MTEEASGHADAGSAHVPESLAGERVDRAVAMVTGWSRRDVRSLVEAGSVLVDGKVVRGSARLDAGSRIEWTAVPEAPREPVGDAAVAVTVVYEDVDVLVVDKPAGLVVHPGAGHRDGTLVNGLLARYDLHGVGDPARPGIVHRLDRDTSGLLVVARSPEAYVGLVASLAAREVERGYDVVVVGTPESTRGTIDAPLGRSTRTPTKMAVRAGGREAQTHYEVIERHADTSRLAVRLETGRTHQIRVHLAAIGHAVLGDAVYGRPDPRVTRPFLHAGRLSFRHPVAGAALRFDSPLPTELVVALESIAGQAPTS